MDNLQSEMMIAGIVQQAQRMMCEMVYAFEHGAKPNGYGKNMVQTELRRLKGTVDGMVVSFDDD